jgi:glutamate:GABA antiporter
MTVRSVGAPVSSSGRRPSTRVLSVPTMALLTSAAIVTSLRGLPLMADEELTMFVYIAFASILFLLP